MTDPDNSYKQNGFKLPDNYFRDLEDNVMKRLQMENQSKASSRVIIHKWAWSMAACLILGSFAFLLFNPKDQVQITMAEQLDQLDSGILAEYSNTIELNDEEFEELIPENIIDSVYHIEIDLAGKPETVDMMIEELEEEYDPLDIDNDI